MARRLGFAALGLLVLAALAYGGICLWFATNERGFVFARVERASTTPEAAGLSEVREVTVPTEDGERLYAWWAPPQDGHGVIIMLVGKGLVASDHAEQIGDLARQGFGVLTIDYRGNGASTGTPSEAGLHADARAAYDFAHSAAPSSRIAAFGQSLGTGFAIGLALDRPVAGVLLNSPYASLRRLFEQRGLPLPYRWLMTDPIDSEAMVDRVRVPVMILHSTADQSIPVAEARRVYAAAHEPKTMIEVDGRAHAELWFGPTRERALAALAAWTTPAAPLTAGSTGTSLRREPKD